MEFATDNLGRNTLHLAVRYNFSEVIPLLKDKKVNMDGRDTEDRTALHIAAGKGDIIMVNALISAGINVNARDGEQKTALHHATTKGQGHADIVKALISAGVDLESKDTQDRSPLKTATRYGCETAASTISKAIAAEQHADTLDDDILPDIENAGRLCVSEFAPNTGNSDLSAAEKPTALNKWVTAVTNTTPPSSRANTATPLTTLRAREPREHPRIPQPGAWGAPAKS